MFIVFQFSTTKKIMKMICFTVNWDLRQKKKNAEYEGVCECVSEYMCVEDT